MRPLVGSRRSRATRALLLIVALALLTVGCGADTPTAASIDTLVDIGAGLQGPTGLQATVYTQGPEKQSAYAVDDAGRLWVATADYTDSGSDAVYMVSATGAAPMKVIAGLHTALGLLWHEGTLYVSSKERVDAYSAFDGTTFASTTEIVALPTGVGENNGLAFGPDGRIRLGISAPCDHCTPTSTYSGAVVSFLPDGHDLHVDASGIRAPVGLAYYPGTADLFATMNQRDDLGDATPGDTLGLVQAGQHWGFPDCYGQGGEVCAGVATATASLDQHAAVGGVAIVTGQLGANVGTAAVVAEWSAGKVQRVALSTDGASYSATVTPFLTGFTNPLPIVQLADGTLLVGDWSTGTIYQVSAISPT